MADKELNKSLTILAKGSIIVFIGIFLSKVLTYLYKIIIARSYGPESYGLFSLALIIVTLFSTLSSMGLSEGLLRYISLYNKEKDFKRVKPLLIFSIYFSIFSGVICTLILFFSSNLIATKIFNEPSLKIYIQYFSLGIPLFLISNLFLSTIKANMQIVRYTFLINILQNTLRILGLFIFLLIGLKSYAIIGSYLLGIISISIGSYLGSRVYLSKIIHQRSINASEETKIRKEFLSYSWPIIFVGFIGALFYWVDSLVIGYLVDTKSVGIYNIATTLVSLLSIAPELFLQMFLPVMLKEYSDKKIEVINQASKQVSKWISLINIPVFTLILIFPEAIITLLFGDQYLAATSSLRILAISGFISAFSGINTALLSMKGKSKSILVTLSISSLVNLILSFILVSSYGVKGAAIATTIVWILTLIAFSVQVHHYMKIIAFRRKMVAVIGVSLIPALIVALLGGYFQENLFGLITAASVYFIIYIVLIFISKSLDQNDYFLIRKIWAFAKYKGFKANSQALDQ